MKTFIGPPIKHSLIKVYGIDEEEANRATEIFRNRYKDYDLLKATPYDGLIELLRSLKREGYLVGVATLKREDYAPHTFGALSNQQLLRRIAAAILPARCRKPMF